MAAWYDYPKKVNRRLTDDWQTLLRILTMNYGPWTITTHQGPSIMNYRLWTMDYHHPPWTIHYGLSTMDYELLPLPYQKRKTPGICTEADEVSNAKHIGNSAAPAGQHAGGQSSQAEYRNADGTHGGQQAAFDERPIVKTAYRHRHG